MMKQILVLLVLSVAALGCADPNIGTVSGTVSGDDEAPETGYVSFTDVDGKTGPVGAKIVDGQYTITLPIGDKKVAVRVPKVVGKKALYENDPNSPVQELTDEALPRWYNDETELTHTVVAGESTQDFVLSTSKKRKK